MLNRFHLPLLILFCLLVLAGPAATSALASGLPVITIVYNGNDPTVTSPAGTPLGATSAPGPGLSAGSYEIDVNVLGGTPDFQLTGPGVNLLLSEPADGAFVVTFEANATYAYVDLNDPANTQRYFTTTSTVLANPTGAAPTLSKTAEGNSDVVGSGLPSVLATLQATIGRKGSSTLTMHGKPVSTLASGQYALVLHDPLAGVALILQRSGHAALVVSAARPPRTARSR